MSYWIRLDKSCSQGKHRVHSYPFNAEFILGFIFMNGLFITLEGVEGAGKSTMQSVVKEFLESQNLQVECTREPGGTKKAEEIRSILLTKDPDEALCDKTELLLMYAARAQLVNAKIKPLLSKGISVLSDRFDLSTVAYQGGGRQMDLKEIAAIRQVAIGDFHPDLTLLFDIDVRQGLERVVKRGKKDRIEEESVLFFERVRQGYLDYAHAHPEEVAIIDGGQALDEVKKQVLQVLSTRVKQLLSR